MIAKSREELLAVVADKNAEIEKIKSKFQNMLETQIGSLQKNMNTQDSRFELELKGLRAIVEMKN